jgi:radical SAM superfamily enzyme YgiQ (UPF0313 family)
MFSGSASDCIEPLTFALLKALTPEHVDIAFYDERLETIPLEEETDAVVLSIGTFTARRAYQIARQYQERGVPVIAGGFHPTLCPDEASSYVNSIVIGDAEDTWPQIIADLQKGTLQAQYRSNNPPLTHLMPDRSIFTGKKYVPIKPVQFGRGCPHHCDFCSIHACYGTALRQRPVANMIQELQSLRRHHILFTDDNLLHNHQVMNELFVELRNAKLRWSCQISLNVTRSPDVLKNMAESGCKSVTVGFESLNPDNLRQMKKTVNPQLKEYTESIRMFHEHGIMVYGTFVFGYDFDTPDSFKKTLDFSLENNLFLTNFNPLIPFPGTSLYARLKKEKRLLNDPWWLSEKSRYGQVAFIPRGMSAEELEEGCYWMRGEFNKHRNIASRLIRNKTNRKSAYHTAVYLGANQASRKEIHRKQNTPFGNPDLSPPKRHTS